MSSSSGFAFTQLQAHVDSLRHHTSPLEFIDDTLVVAGNQLVSGTLEVGPPPHDGSEVDDVNHTIPTLLDDVSVQSHHMNTHHLHVQNNADIGSLTVGSLKVLNKINIQTYTGPVGPQGPCGFATNTGCTGPPGPVQFLSGSGPVGDDSICRQAFVQITPTTAITTMLPDLPIHAFLFQEPHQEVSFMCRVRGVLPIMSCCLSWDWVVLDNTIEKVSWEVEYVAVHPSSQIPNEPSLLHVSEVECRERVSTTACITTRPFPTQPHCILFGTLRPDRGGIYLLGMDVTLI